MSEPSQAGENIVTAAVLVIGDEILSGRTSDRNIGYIAAHLDRMGIRLAEARVVRDVAEEIVAAVNALRARYDYVLTTGGIGPTHDDITADAVAKAFGVGISENEEALARLRKRHGDAELNSGRRRMARIPDGATLIDNSVSQAPGFQIGNVFVMAGVPDIMHAMLDAVSPRLKGGKVLQIVNITTDIREGDAAEPLAALQAAHPQVSIGSYPFFREGGFGTIIVCRSTDGGAARAAANEVVATFEALGAHAKINAVAESEHKI